jgi:voltage-gated potassium channel Kch
MIKIYLFIAFMLIVSVLWLWILSIIVRKIKGFKAIFFVIIGLIGLVIFFGIKYYTIYSYNSKNFYILTENLNIKSGANLFDFIYFSFITITTVGYGDIIPINPMAKFLTIIEVLLGISFVSLILGRLILEKDKLDKN